MLQLPCMALVADKTCHMVDTQALVTHALNATTLLGNLQRKLSNKRKDLIAPTMPREVRDICNSQREVTTQLFGDDLGKSIRETKEMRRLSKEISYGYKQNKKP